MAHGAQGMHSIHCCTTIENKLTENVFVAARIFLGSQPLISIDYLHHWYDVIFCLFFVLVFCYRRCNCPKWEHTWLSIYFQMCVCFCCCCYFRLRSTIHDYISDMWNCRSLFVSASANREQIEFENKRLNINKAIKLHVKIMKSKTFYNTSTQKTLSKLKLAFPP